MFCLWNYQQGCRRVTLPHALLSTREKKERKMTAAITDAFADFNTGFLTVAAVAAGLGGLALLGWCGFRFGAKITNRGVGK